MRLIGTFFIICLFGKLINCNNNNDQSKETNDKSVASNQQQPGPESRQISGGSSMQRNGYNYHENPSPTNNINIYATDLKPNHHSNSPGYIQIQPMLASPFAHQSPEESGSTTFLNFIKPDKHSSSFSSRRASLTNKLKSFMSSLFWKDNSNNASPYMMSSGSSYSYSLQQPPFNFQPSQAQPSSYASNLASANLASAASQYKPVVYGNYQPNSNSYKYPNLFNSQYPNSNANNMQANNQPLSSQQQQSAPQYYYNSAAASNPTYTYTAARNQQNNFNSNQNNHVGFPPSSFQVASSNVNSVYTSSSNQYQSANQANQNNQQELNSNQRSEVPDSSSASVSAPSSALSSASSTNPGNLQLTSNTSNNPVSLIKTNNKQQFSSY